MIIIGIDPGVKTGVAFWDTKKKELLKVESGSLIAIYEMILSDMELHFPANDCFIRIEDARKRKWFGKNSKSKMQGAGSVKRDTKIWQEICEYYEWPYQMIHPIKGATKWDSDKFQRVTGWQGRTNQNARDAAMMVFGLSEVSLKKD